MNLNEWGNTLGIQLRIPYWWSKAATVLVGVTGINGRPMLIVQSTTNVDCGDQSRQQRDRQGERARSI